MTTDWVITSGTPSRPAAHHIGILGRTVLGLTTPLSVTLIAAFGSLFLSALNLPLHWPELFASILISLAAGCIAMAPIMIWVNRPVTVLCRAVLAGMTLRSIIILIGAGLALGPNWHLNHDALIGWVVVLYVTLLVVDTGTAVWLLKHQFPINSAKELTSSLESVEIAAQHRS